MSRRPGAVWLLAVVFTAAAVWWTLWVPYQPERLQQAIPANAAFVSMHSRLASRWDAVSRNPLVLTMLGSVGLKQEDLRKMAGDPETARWIRKLASDEVVLAYVPALGYSARPAWVFASWLGGGSQRLRWSLAWSSDADFKKVRIPGQQPIWLSKASFAGPDMRLSLAFTEGILLGCISTDPTGVRHLLATADATPGMPSIASAPPDRRTRMLSHGAERAPDRGWFRLASSHGAATWTYALSNLTANGASGHVLCDSPLPPSPRVSDADSAEILALTGRAPQGICVLPVDYARLWIESRRPDPWADVAARLLPPRGGGSASPAFVAMLADEYAGRIKGMFGGSTNGPVKGLKVPALLMGFRTGAEAAETEAAILTAIDRLNAAYKTGLIPHRVTVGRHAVTAFDETRNNLYAQLELDERVACTRQNGWLLVCSNLGSLTRLLERADRAESESSIAPPAGNEEASAPDAAAYARVNLDTGGKTIKDVLAAYSLALLYKDAEGSFRRRAGLAEVRAWIETLRPLKTCRVTCAPHSQFTEFDFQIGE